jgi:Type I phosphodiesterase / nucleotide pyrophosphatase
MKRVLAPLLAAALLPACAIETTTNAQQTTPSHTSSELRQQWLDMFARGYFPGRSGQVFYVPHEGDFLIEKDPLSVFMHGSPWSYDVRIPLLLYGPGFIRRGVWSEPTAHQDVVPTLASLLQIAPPATATGHALRQALEAATARPRVIALFVLDGTRADYFDTHGDVMPTLKRLRDTGAWFGNTRVTSLPSATSIGHATLGTGTDPRVHGLVVNRLFNRVTGASQESYDGLDPGELMALTLADIWNLATDGRAVIIGQGGAIRAAAGLVGHGACLVNGRKVLAASYSQRDGAWETNPTCYTLPAALTSISAERFWKDAGGMWMGHDIASPVRFKASALFQRFEGEALAAVLEHEAIGADDTTDLVLVNLKGPDYTSHAYGPASRETRETLAELDRQLARAIQIIEKKAGEGRSILVFTADHGMPGEPPAGRRRITTMEVVEALDQRFSPQPPSIVQYFSDPANAQIHLDAARVTALGFSLKDVAAFLESRFFTAAFTEDEVRSAQVRLPLGK